MRVELARDALDHHHRLLQHHQFEPRRHVEQRGDLEQQRQQLGHRNLVGGARVDRLADRADRLREILDPMDGAAHSPPRNAPRPRAVVARDEAIEDFGEEPSLLEAEPTHDAEIDRDDAPLRVDEEIALMHVGVEEAVAQRMAQERLDQRRAELRRIESELGERDRDRTAATPSIHSIVSTSRVVRSQSIFGHAKLGSSARFSANSEAAAASRRKSISMRTERASVSTTSTRRSRRSLRREPLGASRAAKNMSDEVAREAPLDARPQDLDRDLALAVAVAHAGAMHLRDRGRGHRLRRSRRTARRACAPKAASTVATATLRG